MKLFIDFGISKVYENVLLIKFILQKRDIKYKKCFFIVVIRYRNKERTVDFNQIVKIYSYQIFIFFDYIYYIVYAVFFLRIIKFVKMGKMSNIFVIVIFCNLKKILQKILLDLIFVYLLICDVKVIVKIRLLYKLRDMVLSLIKK